MCLSYHIGPHACIKPSGKSPPLALAENPFSRCIVQKIPIEKMISDAFLLVCVVGVIHLHWLLEKRTGNISVERRKQTFCRPDKQRDLLSIIPTDWHRRKKI